MTIDAGALLFSHNNPLDPGRRIQEEIQAGGIVDACNLMGYDAMGISPYELAAGLEFFKKIKAQSHFPWLSADIVAKATGKPLFTPLIMVEKQGMKIGIIALTGNRAAKILTDSGAEIADWRKILPGLATEMKEKSELTILLSSLTPEENNEISRDFPDINLIFQAGVSTANMAPVLQNKTLRCQTAKQGKYLGELAIKWDKSHNWAQDYRIELLDRQRTLDRINWQLKRLGAKGDSAETEKRHPGTPRKYKFLSDKRLELENEINNLKEKSAASPRHSTWDNQFIAMKISLPDQPEVLKTVNETRKKVNAAGKKQASGIKMMQSYTGSRSCASCHQEQYRGWSGSRHGRAYSTLEEKRQQYNLNCLYCHVTGLDHEKSVIALSLNENLRNVGCESCHGPGKKHINDPENQKMLRIPRAETCLACHQDEHDDAFVYEEAVRRLPCLAKDAGGQKP